MKLCINVGEKSNDSTHPDYVPSIFSFTKQSTLDKRSQLDRYTRSKACGKKRCRENSESEDEVPAHADESTSTSTVIETALHDTAAVTLTSTPTDPICMTCIDLRSQLEQEKMEHLTTKAKQMDAYNKLHLLEEECQRHLKNSATVKEDCDKKIDDLNDECDRLRDELDKLEKEKADITTAFKVLEENIDLESTNKTVVQQLKKENELLNTRISTLTLTEDSMIGNDKKVSFYTGLPNLAILMLVIQYVTVAIPYKKGTTGHSLSCFQEIMLVLMKLRLNLDERDLAYRFEISQSSVSRIFKKWISIMSKRLQFLIRWPSREEVQKTLPDVFKKFFSRCVAIIDCTEVFIEKPSDLKARAQTWSNYKHHNTLKLLISITPQGTISFISKAWGGRVSDKYITEHSGFLEKLIPGDLVLADRGFTVQDSVGLYCAGLKIPPFTKNKKQLSRCEVDWTREIAHVRIHVERVIGLLKNKYTILKGIIPIALLKDDTIDDIVITCCSLCNLSESVIPFQ